MSTTIDRHVTEMRFDNQQFERNAQTSLTTLGKLKQSLNLSGASKGLEDINAAARRMDMSGLSGAVETVRARFSALQIAGVTALMNITNSAVNAGKRIVSALTVDPVKMGFQEYETQINAVQTILANTESKGTTLKDVNGALDELNTYADKTIYNFTEMTRNIGTFTAAGVDLDTSVAAIKGIANLAAVSGSNSQQASTAMYQLSQALASGTVKLMDWNSVVNAGMGGQVFQDALKETARAHGIAIDDMIKKEGSFRETLSNGWLSSEILTETLSKFTGDLTEEQLKSMGYTEEQVKSIMKLGQTANDAATKVKTFTQLFDTLKEAAQSGWTQTWEILIGDFEEAKALLTEISDVVSELINKFSESRNSMLQGWKDLGGRTQMIESFRNIFTSIADIIKPIGKAFREIFPPTTSEQLFKITTAFKDFTEKLKVSDETADKIKRTFKGVFSIFDMFRKVVVAVAKVIGSLFSSGGVTSIADLFLNITASVGDFFTSLNEGFKLDGATKGLSNLASGVSDLIKKVIGSFGSIGDALSEVGDFIIKVAKNIWNAVSEVFSWIADNVSAGDIFAGLAGGGIFVAAKKLSGLFDNIKDAITGLFGGGKSDGPGGIKENFIEVLGSVKDSLNAFTNGIKITSLLTIAASIAILSAAIKTLTKLNGKQIAKSLFSIGILFGMLNGSFALLSKTLTAFPAKGLVKAGFSMLIMAAAIKTLTKSMVKLAGLSFTDISKGLFAIGIGLAELVIGLKAINGVKVKVSTSIAMLALAKSVGMLGDALSKFGEMSWGKITKGLAGMGAALGELAITMKLLNKTGGLKSISSSIGLAIVVSSLSKLADALKKFGEMSWSNIVKGLSGMGGALTEVAGITGLMGKLAGGSSIFAAISLSAVIQNLSELADSFKKFGEMSWGKITKGLVGLGGALGEVAGITGALGKLAGFSGILGSGAILIAVQSLGKLADVFKKFGEMTWGEIGRGLVGMGGALLEVAGFSGALGLIAGFSGILGAGAILIAVQGLGKLADAFKKFGEMSWGEIARGLVGMGGALLEVSGITGALGALAGLPSLLGAGAITLAVQDLGKLADAFKKFGEMSWDEIGRGLAAMGGALGELALGGLLNTLSILGSVSINTVAESLGILADSVSKWSGVKVPEGLAIELGKLAAGISLFTFDGLGAASLALSAKPIGTLADSIKKWTGVTVPEGLGLKLGELAAGIATFTFSGGGAISLAIAAGPVGTLADSVKKWTGVSVPETLKTGLKNLSEGIKSFSWAFMGGWSLSAIDGPLGNLADSVRKWNGVTIPETLKTGLKGLSDGIKSFSWAFVGGWTLSSLVGPLGKLADAVRKWAGVSVPESLKTSLTNLSDGVESFTWAFIGGWSIGSIAGPLGKLADAVRKWIGVTIPKDLSTNLSSLAKGVKSFSGITDISAASNSISKIASSAVKLSSVNFLSLSTSLNTFTKSLISFSTSSASINGVGDRIVKSIIKPLNSAGPKITSAGTNIKKSLTSTIVSITSMIKSKQTSFYSAGSYLVSGFANGISDNAYKAEAKARAMANAAAKAAEEALGINSPSKVFYKIGDFTGMGFVNGLATYVGEAYKTSENVANSASKGLTSAVSKINKTINSDIDVQPTIRPVLDLSSVNSGLKSMNGMFDATPAIGISGSIDNMMSLRSQNGVNDDVVTAINKLRSELGNTGVTTYNINGITYDDGTNVSDAVKSLVRAAKIERRV